MPKRPGDFSEPTKKAIGMRVGYLCSNPSCRCITTGPIESDHKKGRSVGQACHINGVGKKARYDPDLSPKQLADPTNGIWLCLVHHNMVDSDEITYPVDLLKSWKHEAELYALREMGRIPEVKTKLLSDQDFFLRNIKRDEDDRLHISGYIISYDAFFLFDRSVLWVIPKIDKRPDKDVSFEGTLGVAVSHGFLNGMDFVLASRALCYMRDAKLHTVSGGRLTDTFLKYISELEFEAMRHLSNHPFEIFCGLVNGQPKTVIFDLDEFQIGKNVRDMASIGDSKEGDKRHRPLSIRERIHQWIKKGGG